MTYINNHHTFCHRAGGELFVKRSWKSHLQAHFCVRYAGRISFYAPWVSAVAALIKG